MTDVRTIPLSKITVRPDFNPRADVEVDGLVRSVKEVGILTPITVREVPDEDSYLLIAGERRYTAAMLADLDEIPALIRDESDELVVAITENIHREDLNPVDEAKAIARLREQGYTSRRQIAAKLAIPEARVKQREQILKLPESLQEAVAKGDLTLNALDEFAKLADASPGLAAHVWKWARSQDWTAADTAANIAHAIQASQPPASLGIVDLTRPFLVGFDENTPADRVEVIKAFTEKFGSPPRIYPQEDTIDAARAYGCLYEDEIEGIALATDPEWFSDHFKALVGQHLEDWRERIEKGDLPSANDARTPTDPETGKPAEDEDRAKELRSQEYHQREEDKRNARVYNDELAGQLFERLAQVEVDKVVADWLVGLIVDNHGHEWAYRGLRYLHPGLRTVEETKRGEKVTYEEDGAAMHAALMRFLEAPTPQDKIGRLVQLAVASAWADEKAVARTNRKGSSCSPAYGSEYREAHDRAFTKFLNKLTPRMRDRVRTQTQIESANQAESETADVGVEAFED